MKVIVVGEWAHDIYEEALFNAFLEYGIEAYAFKWKNYFSPFNLYKRFQNKFIIGPSIFSLNRDLLKFAKQIQPDLIFIYRGTHIYPSTIKRIRKNGVIIFGYNNDDPFSTFVPKYLFRYYLRSIPFYHWLFAYRKKNISDYQKLGYKNTSVLRSYYIKTRNFPIDKTFKIYQHDVIFIGHFENDKRDAYIKALLDASIDCKVYGTNWEKSKYYKYLGTIFPIYQNDYNLLLNNSKIALVFLSKINNDTYTRRNFEIPAAKTFMLSEFTTDLSALFTEGIEAEYFRNKQELIKKVKYYLSNEKKRIKIADAGYLKLHSKGHEINDRVVEIINIYNEIVTKGDEI